MISGGSPMSKIKRLFWDIETSPNIGFFWRPGWKVKIDPDNIIHERAVICICWKWEGQKKVQHLRWRKGCDMEMICKFVEVLEEANEAVAHNGDKFDMTWYNGRHLIHGLDPIPKTKTVDTYKMAARNFNLNSYKLDYLAKILLGEGKIKTDYDMWKKIVLDNDEAAMKKMIAYCKKDVVLLERVWNRLRDFNEPASHAGVFEIGDQFYKWSCPHCASLSVVKSKTRVTSRGTIQHQFKCKHCLRYYIVSNSDYKRYQQHKLAEKVNRKR
jgi:hypothetical protein